MRENEFLKKYQNINLNRDPSEEPWEWLNHVSNDFQIDSQVPVLNYLSVVSAILGGKIKVKTKSGAIESPTIFNVNLGGFGNQRDLVIKSMKERFGYVEKEIRYKKQETTYRFDYYKKELKELYDLQQYNIFVHHPTEKSIINSVKNNDHGIVIVENDLTKVIDNDKIENLLLDGFNGDRNYNIGTTSIKIRARYLSIALLGNMSISEFKTLKEKGNELIYKCLISLVKDEKYKIGNIEHCSVSAGELDDVTRELINLDIKLLKSVDYEHGIIPFISFSNEAYDELEKVEKELEVLANEYPELQKHIGYYPLFIAKISLIIHMIDIAVMKGYEDRENEERKNNERENEDKNNKRRVFVKKFSKEFKKMLEEDIQLGTVRYAIKIAMVSLNNLFTIYNETKEEETKKTQEKIDEKREEIVNIIDDELKKNNYNPVKMRDMQPIIKFPGYTTYDQFVDLLKDYFEFAYENPEKKKGLMIIGRKKNEEQHINSNAIKEVV